MAKSPFYKITVVETDTDITEWVGSLEHEDCIDKDDLLTLEIGQATADMISGPNLRKGNTLRFEYGFDGGERSGARMAMIKKIKRKYSTTWSITVIAHDKGFFLKKKRSSKVYSNMTASQIVKEIADLFGMEIDIEDTTKVYASMPQGNRTYFQFIKYLASLEGVVVTVETNLTFDEAINEHNINLALRYGYVGGLDNLLDQRNVNLAKKLGFKIIYPADPFLNENRQRARELGFLVTSSSSQRKGAFEFFIRGNTLYFKRRDLSKESIKTYVIGDPDGKVLDFSVDEEERSSGGNSEVSSSGINPETGEVFTEVANNESVKETALGNDMLNFDVNGILKPGLEDQSTRTGKTKYQPVDEDKKEVTQSIGKSKTDASMGGLKGTLELELDLSVKANEIISIAGVPEPDAGNWRTVTVKNKIDTSGGKTTITLDKNAAKRGRGRGSNGGNNSVTSGENTTSGSTDGKTTTEIGAYNFDEDGNPLNNFINKTGQILK